MTAVYQAQDINSVLYNAIDTPLTADGNSSEIDFGVDGGCPDGELVFNLTDRETGESITFIVQDYISAAFADTVYQMRGIAADGVYVLPINNRMVTGSKLRIKHDITLSTTTKDGIKVHAHFRPFPVK